MVGSGGRPAQRRSSGNSGLLRALLTATGLALGAGIYESRVVIPQWAARPTPQEIGPALERSGHLASGRRFWPLIGLPIVPLTAANVGQALCSHGPRKPWWLAFSGTIAAACVATAGYFVPALHRLAHAEDLPEEQVRTLVSRRVRLDRLRLAVGGLAWLAGLQALALPGARPPDNPPAGRATTRPGGTAPRKENR